MISSAGLLAASVGCRWASDSEDVKYGRNWPCDEGSSDTVSFSFQMHSVDNDHVLVAWGFCASEDACGGDFQNSDCDMESDELNDNLPHTFGSVATNEKYKNNVACMQVKCDNWVEDCQMTFDSVDMSPPSSSSAPSQLLTEIEMPPAVNGSTAELRLDFATAMARLGNKLSTNGATGYGGAKYHRGLNNNHHLHCDATASSGPLQPKTVTLPPSQLEGIAALPAEKDWSGEMNPVKDQEACGSCWAFATNAIVEFSLGAKGRGVVNPAELMDKSLRMHPYADSDDGHCRAGADAVDRKCGGSGACEGLTSLAGLDILKCEPGSVHLWPDAQAEAEMYEEYFHCLKDGPNSCKYANDGECDDGSQGGTQYCAAGTDTNDCAAAKTAVRGSDTCRYAFDHECDDGSQGGAKYCDTGTDATDCAETAGRLSSMSSMRKTRQTASQSGGGHNCDFQQALQKLTKPLATESLDGFDIFEMVAFVDADGKACDMNSDDSECYPNVHGMMEALQHGPIAVGVDASPLESYRPSWSSTKSRTPYVVSADATKCETMCGSDESCRQECHDVASKAAAAQQTPTVDHAVVIVGYGTDDLGGPYWKIRNSWSEKFGEAGHVKVEREVEAVPCGVDTRLQDGNGCKVDEDGVALAEGCSARYCGAMGVISPGIVQLRPASGGR